MVKLDWTRRGPARPEAMELPPISMRLNGYVMDHDPTIGEIVYLCGEGYDGFGESWGWNGSRFRRLQQTKLQLEGEGRHHGYYDASRQGMVAFQFSYDDEKELRCPRMMLVTAESATAVDTCGDHPIAGEDGDFGGAFAYDRQRDVGVCLTPHGVWELDAKGEWTKICSGGPELVPQAWSHCGGVWDPRARSVMLWVFERENYTHEFYRWDGRELTRLPVDGLPLDDEGLCEFDIDCVASASLVGHPVHGVVLADGAHLWAFDGQRWSELSHEEAPPRMAEAHLAYDPDRRALLLGPGYHEGDGGGRGAQQVFFTRSDRAWTTLGLKVEASPVLGLHGRHTYFACKGETHVVPLNSLRTMVWRDDAWLEVVDTKAGGELTENDHVGAVVGMGDHAIAILRKGTVCRFDGEHWTKTDEVLPKFKERMDFTLARVGSTDRLIVWGGLVNNRKSNDTFVRDGGTWRKTKKASPRPQDFGLKNGPSVDFDSFYDTTSGRVVRIGLQEAFTFEAEQWKPHTPAGYGKLAGSRTSEHFPVHDEVTGETLLVQLRQERIVRFDLNRCQEIGAILLPHDEVGPKQQHDHPTWSRLEPDLWYDAPTRTLHAQYCEDRWAQYQWDLSEAFDAAAAMGGRPRLEPLDEVESSKKPVDETMVAAPEDARARLYFVDEHTSKFWYIDVKGSLIERRWGRIAAKATTKIQDKASSQVAHDAAVKLIAKKLRDGYVSADELKLGVIASLGAVPSRPIEVGSVSEVPLDHANGRIGGLPSGIGRQAWPTHGDESLGFLFQIPTGEVLAKHAGVAVFCTTDGSATEDQSHNVAVLLTKSKWKEAPPMAAPAGVEVLPVRPLTFGESKLEIVEGHVQRIASDDAELGARFDALQASSEVHRAAPSSKQGGVAGWVQDPAMPDDWILAAQLDFDGIRFRGPWKSAGLFGVVYVFVSPDERQAIAMWQHT